MKYKDTPVCTFCKMASETIEHLFWHCPVISQFIRNLFSEPETINSKLSIDTFILGWRDMKHPAFNLVILYTKMYIFNCKRNEVLPTVPGAKQYIYFQYRLAKETATIYGKANSFEQHWNSLSSMFGIL